jgi:hypothetical protein
MAGVASSRDHGTVGLPERFTDIGLEQIDRPESDGLAGLAP